jgi:hypothetical protein
MSEQTEPKTVEIVRLYVGRGLHTDPFGVDDEKLELSVDLYDLGTDYAAAWVAWAAADGGGGGGASLDDTAAWMPLVDSDGLCVLDSDGNLIPTLVTL